MFVIQKEEGKTPLEALEELRREKGLTDDVPMTYAGRLDPMAEGRLLILVGDECKKKEEYLGLDKEYEIEVLLGIGSDTGDVLGVIEIDNRKVNREVQIGSKIGADIINEKIIAERIKFLTGKRSEKYPSFSSKTVNGKPLFVHMREGGIKNGLINDGNTDAVEIPEKIIEIYEIDLLGIELIGIEDLIKISIERIKKVKGDFRQNEIIQSWQKNDSSSLRFQIIKLRVKSSSGAYMRTLAQKFGELCDTKAIAWKIKRTKIGDYSIN